MKILLLITVLIFIPASYDAQTAANHAEDESAIRTIVKGLSDAWAAGDGEKYAGYFTEDAEFTVWNGMHFSGRNENAKNHQQIFDTFYKGTKVESKVRKISFLTDDVAAVHLEAAMYRAGKPVEDVPNVVPLMILKKSEGRWQIAVFQNTPVIRRGELVVGRKGEGAPD